MSNLATSSRSSEQQVIWVSTTFCSGDLLPSKGIGPGQLTLEPLAARVEAGGIRELIMATNPTLEGDGTALLVANRLAEFAVPITRLARGLASGGALEFANKEMLADALNGRQSF